MAYDLHHQKLGIKAIGTVESNLTYDAINYNDPITVGVAQWYGTRAASILNRIRNDNPSSWTGVLASLTNDLNNQNQNSAWWTTRYLTRAEGASIKPVLLANQSIQNAQFITDLDGYMDNATRMGMDIQNNTLAALFYASMYHQSPRSAQRVLSAAGPQSNLARLHAAALNDSVLGRYRTRQNTVRDILLSGDTSGVDDPHNPSPDPEGTDQGDGLQRMVSNIAYLKHWGNSVYIVGRDGTMVNALHSGPGVYTTKRDESIGADVPDLPPNLNPDVPPGSPIAVKRDAIRTFLTGLVGQFKYSQGPGRLNPESSGYTDCSALMHWAFKKVLGISMGTYTGAQYTQGTRVASGSGNLPFDRMAVGDLIYFNWPGGRNTVDHVEMYYGGTQEIGHGGPGNGPTIKQANPSANRALNWYVQRFIV